MGIGKLRRLALALMLAAMQLAIASASQSEGGPVVLMFEYSYSPKTITVPAGTTITWRNTGNEAHTATLPGVFDTGSVAPGGEATVTFTEPGTYQYFDQIHGGPGGAAMNGTVVVTAASGSPEQPLPGVGAAPQPAHLLTLIAGGLILLGLGLRAAR